MKNTIPGRQWRCTEKWVFSLGFLLTKIIKNKSRFIQEFKTTLVIVIVIMIIKI